MSIGNEESSEAHEKKEDADVIEAIQQILADHRPDIENYEAIQGLYKISSTFMNRITELINHNF